MTSGITPIELTVDGHQTIAEVIGPDLDMTRDRAELVRDVSWHLGVPVAVKARAGIKVTLRIDGMVDDVAGLEQVLHDHAAVLTERYDARQA
jgi:hypothetical protein